MFLKDHVEFLKNALTGVAPINGMYAIYTTASGGNTTMTAIDNAVSGGATLRNIADLVISGGGSTGMCRIPQIAAGGINSGGGAIQLVGTTLNQDGHVGVECTGGVYVSGVVNASLSTATTISGGVINVASNFSDKGLDYNTISGGAVVPTNGGVTIINKVTL